MKLAMIAIFDIKLIPIKYHKSGIIMLILQTRKDI